MSPERLQPTVQKNEIYSPDYLPNIISRYNFSGSRTLTDSLFPILLLLFLICRLFFDIVVSAHLKLSTFVVR